MGGSGSVCFKLKTEKCGDSIVYSSEGSAALIW